MAKSGETVHIAMCSTVIVSYGLRNYGKSRLELETDDRLFRPPNLAYLLYVPYIAVCDNLSPHVYAAKPDESSLSPYFAPFCINAPWSRTEPMSIWPTMTVSRVHDAVPFLTDYCSYYAKGPVPGRP